MSLPTWITEVKAWMRPSLGNIYIPGHVLLRKISKRLKHTAGKGSGKDFGVTYIQGAQNPDFEFDILLMTLEDQRAWERVEPIYMPRTNPEDRKSLAVTHPMLQSMGIYSCIPVEIEKEFPLGGNPMKIILKCIASMPEIAKAAKAIKYKPKKISPAPYLDLPGAKFADSIHQQADERRGDVLAKPNLF